ncbi:phosphorylase family protein [Arcobacter porcinus]|uniref:Phosphorylase superfamily protein n=1 Tax=Arcobacter porcinus TaxID=1935204 RepID=A0ABX2YBJ6_9BACT|nr:purine-nucleoside phosphorylase [Arcobacter porcinus]OCL84224.1 Phosphorylase superfamily protein [Arcobacter porcinus]OCL84744.1 Phosphorylase superfamily protein [Arcobacter porcinus]OCL89288.1 Phosphorylase superfamily protein [Arcobacter porcinus]OCL91708.1 Phosphorylase superfamily protein [Arcobacter porcinus]
MIVCAGRNERFQFAKEIGVGLIESSINLTKICLFNRPEFILFIGSAGSYGKHNIFDIVESKSASNVELSYVQNLSYTPLDNIIEIGTNFTKSEVIVNSSNYISTNKELSKEFMDYNLELENMEFFSVLSVAKEFEIPAFGIFVVTNYTDENAHEDFVKNHNLAMQKLITYLEEKNIIKAKEAK